MSRGLFWVTKGTQSVSEELAFIQVYDRNEGVRDAEVTEERLFNKQATNVSSIANKSLKSLEKTNVSRVHGMTQG
jgi:hypothetical protein